MDVVSSSELIRNVFLRMSTGRMPGKMGGLPMVSMIGAIVVRKRE